MTELADVTDHAVAVYATHTQAEESIKALNSAGYNMRNLSIIGQNYHSEEHPVGFMNSGDRMLSWGKLGAFWGSIWGLLVGSAMLFVPGVGFIVFGGWLVATLGGAVLGGGLAVLGAALTSLGIPENSVVEYQSEVKAGRFLVLVHGTEDEVKRAKASLSTTGATRVDAYAGKPTVRGLAV